MSIKIAPITFESTARINLKGFQATFGIVCRLLPIDELEALRKQWIGTAPTETEPGMPPSITDREFIDAWLVGFADDVLGPDDQPLPFTPVHVTQLLAQPGAKQAVLAAFFDGYEEAETKNSETPPGGLLSPAAA